MRGGAPPPSAAPPLPTLPRRALPSPWPSPPPPRPALTPPARRAAPPFPCWACLQMRTGCCTAATRRVCARTPPGWVCVRVWVGALGCPLQRCTDPHPPHPSAHLPLTHPPTWVRGVHPPHPPSPTLTHPPPGGPHPGPAQLPHLRAGSRFWAVRLAHRMGRGVPAGRRRAPAGALPLQRHLHPGGEGQAGEKEGGGRSRAGV